MRKDFGREYIEREWLESVVDLWSFLCLIFVEKSVLADCAGR